MKILITGGNGYIAKTLFNSLKSAYDVVSINRNDFDLRDSKKTNKFFEEKYFDVVIHCAVVGGSRLRQDSWDVLDDNLKMYYNLLSNRQSFKKLINFGSGAEINSQNTPYGFSKHVIRQSVLSNKGFYNLRIYAVFDENELDSRFIKSNIKRYIDKKPMEIHQDKYMSFFYMEDLIRIVHYYIQTKNPQKELNCVYNTIFTLNKIADIINSLDDYKVDIVKNENGMGNGYYGENLTIPNIEYAGLEYGIKNVYNKLKYEIL